MPAVTRWYVKTSLVYLIAALLAGLVLADGSLENITVISTGLMPVYLHLFVVGWITQFIFGIAFWMFPKYSRGLPRGNERLAWLTYSLLNVGLLARAAGEPLVALGLTAWGWLLVVSAVLQWTAGICFFANTWARVKER